MTALSPNGGRQRTRRGYKRGHQQRSAVSLAQGYDLPSRWIFLGILHHEEG